MKKFEETGQLALSKRKRDNHFSEEIWSDVAVHYQISIEGLSEDAWDTIIDGAWKIYQEKPAGRASSSRVPGGQLTQLPEVNERELLVEGSDGECVEDDEDEDWDNISYEVCKFYE